MSAEAFDPTDWAGYFEITSDNTKVDEAVGVVGFDLSNAPAGFWSAVASDGKDIRITNDDGTFAYSRELVDFSVGDEAGWVLFDSSSVISTSADKTWRVYAGNASATEPAASDTLGRNAVWAGDVVVQHMAKNLGGVFVDSTGNGHDGATAAGTTTTVAGKIGSATDMASAHITCGTGVDNGLGSGFTLECWVNPDTLPAVGGIMGNYDGQNGTGANRNGMQFRAAVGKLELSYTRGGNTFVGRQSNDSSLAASAWQRLMATWDGTFSAAGFRIYRNGVRVDTTNFLSGTVTSYEQSSLPFTLGAINFLAGPQYMDGKLDFVRVSAGARSANYDTTNYNWQSSPGTFWSAGAWTSAVTAYQRRRTLSMLGSRTGSRQLAGI